MEMVSEIWNLKEKWCLEVNREGKEMWEPRVWTGWGGVNGRSRAGGQGMIWND